MAYAVVRYNVFKGVEWIHLPLYIVNKATSLSAVILLASAYLVGRWIPVHKDDPERRLVLIKFLGLAGFGLAALHSLMSMALLGPTYYPKFFGAEKMNLVGELTILFGVVGMFWLASPAVTSLPNMQQALGDTLWKRAQRAGYVALAFTALHCFAMGVQGWLEPETWPGSLPPITMLAFVIGVVPLVARLVSPRALVQEREESPDAESGTLTQ